jgi:hypothetical protein
MNKCEACGRESGKPFAMRTVGTDTTGDKEATVCVDSTACQRRMVALNRKMITLYRESSLASDGWHMIEAAMRDDEA